MSKTKDTKPLSADIIDIDDFNERIVEAYNLGIAERSLDADLGVARSLVPAGTGAFRDFSYIAPDIPEFISENCVGCMECVVQCPDTAILGKVVPKTQLGKHIEKMPSEDHNYLKKQFAETGKFYKTPERKGNEGGLFGIFVDPTKCKGCGECVEVCGSNNALKMIAKNDDNLKQYKKTWEFYKNLPETPAEYISEKALADMMLAERSILFVGGAASCMGCGEVTALRMMLAATGFVYGKDSVGLVAATGCNTVYGSTYPYNPFLVPWSNSLFENVATVAMGVRMRWDQLGWQDKKVWAIGGDGAMYDIGFQPLSRMLSSGMNVNAIVLDTQVYSNTGGQTSTASFIGQDAKLSYHGKSIHGKVEPKKEIAQIAMMHPDVFVAQTTCAHINHFYKSIMAANEYEGPSIVSVYSTCQPEHGVPDDMSRHQAKLATDSRAFPIFTYDPRRGEKISERLDLKGNPAVDKDWYTMPKTDEVVDFISFAKTERRFIKHFDKNGNPSDLLLKAQKDRLKNWRHLQELAGII
ncbi:MAG: thiamine pyrophosphate-dependent enzyme [Spirochaetota bacterium]|nr:thiamine pyrophosphate-dependent enzyme [Spirochaetota bacterium]